MEAPLIRRSVRLQSLGADPLIIPQELVPPIPSGGALVEVICAGVSNTAKGIFAGKGHFKPPVPLIPGTSCVGNVVATAPNVTGLAIGQMVVLDPLFVAGTNNPSAPHSMLLMGLFPLAPATDGATEEWKNGTWTSLAVLPASNLTPVPQSLMHNPMRLLAINNLSIAYGALSRGGIKAGHTVLITGGTGVLGACTAQLCLALGAARVYVVGRNRDALDKLLEVLPGAEGRLVPVVLDVERTPTEQLTAVVGPEGVDLAVDFLGYVNSPDITVAAIACLKQGGTAVLAGGVMIEVPVNYVSVVTKELTIVGSFMYKKDVPACLLRLMESGILTLAHYDVEQFPLENALEAVDRAASKNEAFGIAAIMPNGLMPS